MTHQETIRVEDSHGFYYDVGIDHSPQWGFSTAFYQGRIIAQCDLYKLHCPMSDDDREWEQYEERSADWKAEIKVNLIPQCKEYFDKQT